MGRISAALIVIMVILLAVGAAGNWLYSYEEQLQVLAREPLCDRWLATIEQDLGSQQYQEAIHLIDGLSLSYPFTGQAQVAQGLYPQALLGQALGYREQGDYRYAMGRLDQLLRSYPESQEAARARELYPSLLLEKALQNWNAGDRQQAVSGFDALLVKYPESPEAARARELYPSLLLEEVLLYKDAGKYSDALSLLAQLQREYPDSGEAAQAEDLEYEIYGIMRDESIASDLAVVNAMFPARVGQRLAATACLIRDASDDPYSGGFAGFWDGYRIVLYTPVAFSSSPNGIILHEWGHVIDDYFLSDAERAQYRRMRDISSGIPWHNYEVEDYDQVSYWNSPDEDFASVFRAVMSGSKIPSSSPYGQVADPAQMEVWMVEATSN